MHKINLTEAEACLAALVKEVANGEEVVIIEESGLAVKLVLVADIPSSSGSNQDKLFNPEGLWDQAEPITSQDIAEVRKEMWHKFEQKD
jgi:antitoxin (DNA-binding transcriptional repressor) of toxin-antitoxin stability system